MKIHLIDGTYELFRNHFGAPPKKAPDGREVGATLGLMRSLLMLLTSPDVTHVGWPSTMSSSCSATTCILATKPAKAWIPTCCAVSAGGGGSLRPRGGRLVDGGIRGGRRHRLAVTRFQKEQVVEQFVICSPDKDLAQLVSGDRIVCWDRRREIVIDEAGVVEKFGVSPESIPDWLAVVGDSADGYPGVPGWGAKSASAVLSRYHHLENIPTIRPGGR